jgi:hypothetical protein
MTCRPVECPSKEHEDRVAMLEDIAILMGYHDPVETLPGWLRPDVCRDNRSTGGVFVGDAKVSETPGCRSTQHRFLRYGRWLARSGVTIESSVCAICFSDICEIKRWRRFLATILMTNGIICTEARATSLDFPIIVLLARLCRLESVAQPFDDLMNDAVRLAL